MGGSAAGGNAQLFSLLQQYGDGSGKASGTSGRSTSDLLSQEMARQVRAGAGVGGMHYDPYSLFSVLDRRGARGGGTPNTGGGGPTTGTGTGGTTTPPGFSWSFPQYTQSWAFTPPTPTPYMNPQPFDPSKYGNPLTKKGVKKNT